MITSNTSGRWMHVMPAIAPQINAYSNSLSVGQLRYNPSYSCMEIYDGFSWQQYRIGATIDLSSDAQQTLEWAYNKMLEEKRLNSLMEKHPGLCDLHERFEVMLALVQRDDHHGS